VPLQITRIEVALLLWGNTRQCPSYQSKWRRARAKLYVHREDISEQPDTEQRLQDGSGGLLTKTSRALEGGAPRLHSRSPTSTHA
jgi:hypothetical protein